jgi:hypothetical protein
MPTKHLLQVALIFAVTVSVAIVATYQLTAPLSFDPVRWMDEPEDRYRMLTSLVDDVRLHNAREGDVVNLLGEPNERRVDNATNEIHLIYWVANAGIDDLWLVVRLKDDRVVALTTRPD